MRINKSEIEESIVYTWICPECGKVNQDYSDPDDLEYYHCSNCSTDIELQEE